MPALTPTEKTVAATDLRVIRGYELGLAAVGQTIFVAMELESGGEKRTYILSLASAVTFCADMTAVIESDEGLGALVAQTLSDARAMKAGPGGRNEHGEYEYDASIIDRRCGTCRATGRSQFAQPCPDCLAVR